MAMISLLVRIEEVCADMFRSSLPAINGAASMHHNEKWALSSLYFMPLPTSSISGSFQWPGPAYCRMLSCRSRIFRTLNGVQPLRGGNLSKAGPISPVLRHNCPSFFAQRHGICCPHSQRLNTIGLPAARIALLMVAYASCALIPSVLHQSNLR